jgi:hypothetical protein
MVLGYRRKVTACAPKSYQRRRARSRGIVELLKSAEHGSPFDLSQGELRAGTTRHIGRWTAAGAARPERGLEDEAGEGETALGLGAG